MKICNKSAITIYRTEELLTWLKAKGLFPYWNMDCLNHHPNVYLVDVEDQNCWGDCFEECYQEIAANELSELGIFETITIEAYRRWFRYEYHESIYNLSTKSVEWLDE